MPFLTAPFQLRLQESFDKDAPNYSAPTEGELDAYGNPSIPHLWATAWSEATEAGAKGLMSIPAFPPVNNFMLALGKQAMYGVLIGNNPYTPPFSVLKSGFTTFAATILAGWMPTYMASPPSGPPNFESLSQIGNATTVNTPWIVQCGTLLTSWFMTGMLIPTPAGAAMYAPPSNWL
jgi:hypothetical protein|tara:strand:+ start:9607 stop:10137 length:531 start_codon:yes stop_codon:yes gene_type:complete